MQPVLDRLAAAVLVAFGSPACSVALLDEQQEHLRYLAAAGSTAERIVGTVLPVARGIAGWVAQSGESIEVGDVEHS